MRSQRFQSGCELNESGIPTEQPDTNAPRIILFQHIEPHTYTKLQCLGPQNISAPSPAKVHPKLSSGSSKKHEMCSKTAENPET